MKFYFGGQSWSLLSWTTGMKCWSLSLPAHVTCPGASYEGPDAVCGACYAQTGHYNMPAVINAQAARYGWLRAQELVGDFQPFISRMVLAIESSRYFRWFDSGDLYSVPFAKAVREVCKQTRHCHHWIPTHSWRSPNKLLRAELRYLHQLANVMVRPSARDIGTEAPVVAGLGPGLAVHRPGGELHRACPKAENHTDCEAEGCRACWSSPIEISFRAHGRGDTLIRSTPASRQKRASKVLAIIRQ